ncbi:DUF2254 domain-containing protein [Pseudoalteromonas viridis]|uniref:DUF2254 domain-containing protein n=1 Tax=Pseudoalteromonas viridis TaxID=339617 RepID=A0ABX7V3M6_9GAMM|nr:DUF2254 domain-containing protein [Pseudoalteromonas viridis]QTL34337.1 DUF2254 domain-containing protein [Pseudoalteromonas viridis]
MFESIQLRGLYLRVINSIGFYPALLVVISMILSTAFVSVEYLGMIQTLKARMAFFLVDTEENARAILTVLIGSVISLTVFSFSMVMVVLNTAGSNLSPRLIPGLVTRKPHQLVLGFYLGTIIFSTIMLINLDKQGSISDVAKIPSLGILFALLMGLVSLILFVYFIHSISREVQVDNVLDRLFRKTKQGITEVIAQQAKSKGHDLPDVSHWYPLTSLSDGYYKGMDKSRLLKVAKKHNLTLYITIAQSDFVFKGQTILLCNEDIGAQDELHQEINACIIFYVEEYVSDHYSYGLKQISEIAVKALSPGINDPGTAAKAIDILCVLLIRALPLAGYTCIDEEDSEAPAMFCCEPSFERIVFDNLVQIKSYAKSDVFVVCKLIRSVHRVLISVDDPQKQEVLFLYMQSIVCDASAALDNRFDKAKIISALKEVQSTDPEYAEQLLKGLA